MSKRVNRTPWIFDAAAQMEGRDRSGAYPGLINAPFHTVGTFTTSAAEVTTMTDHGFGVANAIAGPVRVTTSAADLPSGLVIDLDYFVRVIDRDTFAYFATLGAAQATDRLGVTSGTPVAIADAGTGTHTLVQQNIYNLPLSIEQIKVDTGAGGDFLLTWSSDAGDRLLKLDNTPANDTLWVPIRKRVEAIYIQTLPANATVEVYTGDDWDS